MKRLLRHLRKRDILSASMSDALDELSEFVQEVRRVHLEEFKSFTHQKQGLDQFYFKQDFDIRRHGNLCFVLKIIFTLSHGQAAVERGFNINIVSKKII